MIAADPIDIHTKLGRYFSDIDTSFDISQSHSRSSLNVSAIDNIVDLFADNAVYERAGWDTPFIGKDRISHFLRNERQMVGSHLINDGRIDVNNGLDAAVADKCKKYFPNIDPAQCKTAKITGIYAGAQCVTDRSDADTFVIKYASNITLKFDDYWVFDQEDKVIYRYSYIRPITKNPADSRHKERY